MQRPERCNHPKTPSIANHQMVMTIGIQRGESAAIKPVGIAATASASKT
jgi:hypothetical protein